MNFFNEITQKGSRHFPLGPTLDMTDLVMMFSKVDLIQSCHQIPDDICKTAILTLFGLTEFVWMPFGLMNS